MIHLAIIAWPFIFSMINMIILVYLLKFSKKYIISPILKILKTSTKQPLSRVSATEHLDAIAGDDVLSTQLDLARAYLELGKYQSAKELLDYILTNGNTEQRETAKNLMIMIV